MPTLPTMTRLVLVCATAVAGGCPTSGDRPVAPRTEPVAGAGTDAVAGSGAVAGAVAGTEPVAVTMTGTGNGTGAGTRIAIAQAEARRGAGIDALLDAARGTGGARWLALRGLARTGGARARAALRAALAGSDADDVAVAAGALGVAAALADEAPEATRIELTNELLAALPHAPAGVRRAAVLEAIARTGDPR